MNQTNTFEVDPLDTKKNNSRIFSGFCFDEDDQNEYTDQTGYIINTLLMRGQVS